MLTSLPPFGAFVLELTALALAMNRHGKVLARPWQGRSVRQILRFSGVAMLASVLIGAVDYEGPSQGVVIGMLLMLPGPARPSKSDPKDVVERRVSRSALMLRIDAAYQPAEQSMGK